MPEVSHSLLTVWSPDMSIKGRITESGIVLETCCEDVATCFHPDLAKQFVDLPDGAEPGDTVTDGKVTKYVQPEPPEIVKETDRKITRQQFLECFTRSERKALKSSTDEDVIELLEFMQETNHYQYDDAENKTLITALVAASTISQSSADKLNSILD